MKYLKEIYTINLSRNKILLKELNFISKIFLNHKINHVFLKGSALLIKNYYEDLGERMVGDIDILVDEKDYIKSVNLMKENGYVNIKNESKFDSIHYPRLVSGTKTFALEIHKKLLKGIASSELINISEYINKVKKYIIYKFQIGVIFLFIWSIIFKLMIMAH